MASASFLVGILPLTLTLNSRQLRLITALGTGVLVGTSLIVIIPEGIETLYEASGSSHDHAERSISLAPRSAQVESIFPGSMKHDDWRQAPTYNLKGQEDEYTYAIINQRQDETPEDDKHDEPHDGNEHTSTRNPHTWTSLSLISGFLLMYLLDTLPDHLSRSTKPLHTQISLNSLSLTRAQTDTPETPTTASHHHSSTSTTTLGLLIHALADGIALGASSTTTTGHLTIIIFFALMLHKAPAAFGLTSVLLKQGLSKRAARGHLIVFSAAAPVGALFTWGAAHVLGYRSDDLVGGGGEFVTGCLLVFSGGTFLYVAVHTMQEAGSGSHGHDERMNGYVEVNGGDIYGNGEVLARKEEKGGLIDVLVTAAGMLVPLLGIWGHAH